MGIDVVEGQLTLLPSSWRPSLSSCGDARVVRGLQFAECDIKYVLLCTRLCSRSYEHPPHSWLPAEKRVTAARIHLDPAETARTELCSDPKIYRPKLKNTRMELSSAEEWTAHVSHVKGVKMKQTCPIMAETVRTSAGVCH